MTEDLGFTWRTQRTGEVVISHHGKQATILRGDAASDFREDMEMTSFADQQQIMARLTGNYKHGNEREAKNHPRNRM